MILVYILNKWTCFIYVSAVSMYKVPLQCADFMRSLICAKGHISQRFDDSTGDGNELNKLNKVCGY